MTLKKNCDDWVKYARENWLNNWIRASLKINYLDQSAWNMIKRMKKAADEQRNEEAWNLMERLKRLSGTFYGTGNNQDINYHDQWAEIYMECALVAYDLGDLSEALELLRTSIGNFYQNRTLHKAVNYWFVGCVQWQLPAHSEEAVVSWERAMKIVKDTIFDLDNQLMRDKVIEEMRLAINTATNQGYPDPPPPQPAAAKTNPGRNAARTPVSVPPARLKLLPYFGAIPAGGPSVVDSHPDMVDVESLEIDGQFYGVFGVRGEREVRMKPSSRYFLAKADGKSMNVADPVSIQDQDYVLLEVAESARQRDIVAAIVFDPSGLETATLKRYYVENGRQVLRYESDVEELRNLVITMSGKDHIQGVVVAILKPQ